MKSLWITALILCVVIVLASSRMTTSVHNYSRISFPDSLFHNGDIIFRDGRGVISTIFRNMSLTDQSFSHGGIIHIEGTQCYVYHVIGGEGRNSVMRKEKIENFCNRNEAASFAIFRTDLDGKKIDSAAGIYYNKRILFDDKFDLHTDDKMYCTELIYKIFTRLSANNNFIPLTTVNNVSYCSCDNIFLSPHLNRIYSYNYQ
jgi:hypothetical protein